MHVIVGEKIDHLFAFLAAADEIHLLEGAQLMADSGLGGAGLFRQIGNAELAYSSLMRVVSEKALNRSARSYRSSSVMMLLSFFFGMFSLR